MTSLRVMTFNIFWGGTRVSFDTIVRAAEAADVDVIVIQEAVGNSQRLATALDWAYVSPKDIISRLPMTEENGYVLVDGVAIVNVKLPAGNYGPYVTKTLTEPAIVEIERNMRVPPLETLLAPVKNLNKVIVAGDFNAPSHLDWTRETVLQRPQMTYPVSWPTSIIMHQACFIDSYRVIFPNPRIYPGLTWWAAHQPVTEPRDRIDFIYSKGLEVLDSQLLGADDITPWGTDHNAVISTFGVIK